MLTNTFQFWIHWFQSNVKQMLKTICTFFSCGLSVLFSLDLTHNSQRENCLFLHTDANIVVQINHECNWSNVIFILILVCFFFLVKKRLHIAAFRFQQLLINDMCTPLPTTIRFAHKITFRKILIVNKLFALPNSHLFLCILMNFFITNQRKLNKRILHNLLNFYFDFRYFFFEHKHKMTENMRKKWNGFYQLRQMSLTLFLLSFC